MIWKRSTSVVDGLSETRLGCPSLSSSEEERVGERRPLPLRERSTLQRLLHCTGAFLLAICALTAAEPQVDDSQLPRVPPTPPEKALSTFKVKPGFRLELVAAEPLVVSPVAMSFDENGRLYVIEMRDYSERRPERLGRVRLLQDTDGDGRFDKSTVFADNLPWPTAVICWAGGVFVGATPDILWFKDTDGDGKADEREVIFTGFASDYAPFATNKLNVQALMNSFNWSLDNRIHGATSFSGGKVKLVDSPFVRDWLTHNANPVPGDAVQRNPKPETRNPKRETLDLRGRDFSFDPRTLEMRPESGGGQHGMTFDNRGRKFVCSNSDHIQQIMYEDRYASRNPYYNMPSPRVSIAVDGPAAEVFRISPDEPWRVLRTQWRVAGLVSGPVEGGGRPSGYFTGATGVTIYRGDAYGEEFVGDAFIGDAGSNLVHRKKLRPDGLVLRAERPADEQKVEFLASTDNWFRPVQFANAPDGCLYIVDMYREVIEHPWSLPANLKKHLDLNSGNDRGRIYRVVPENFKQRPIPHLGKATTDELARLLAHPNGWHRDTAARLICEKQDTNAIVGIRQVQKSGSSLARIHTLHCLAGLQAISLEDLYAFGGKDPELVAVHWLRVAEEASLLANSDRRMQKFLELTSQNSSREVQFQFALSIITFQSEHRVEWLANLARHHGTNRWLQAALVNSAADQSADLFEVLARGMAADTVFGDGRWAFLGDLAQLVGANGRTSQLWQATDSLTRYKLGDSRWMQVVTRFLEGMRDAKRSFQREGLTQVLKPWFDEATKTAAADYTPDELRVTSIRLIGLSGSNTPPPLLYSLLDITERDAVRAAALAEIGRFGGIDPAEHLIELWPKFSPSQRSAAMELLLKRPERIPVLLAAADRGIVRPTDLSAAQLQFLRSHTDASIRAQALQALGRAPASSRQIVVDAYASALQLKGTAADGLKIFQSRCATCHLLGTEGTARGIDLATVKNAGKEKVLTSILDPNREVAANFLCYLVETKDGESFTAIISSENAGSVTLRQANGQETTLSRSSIRTLQSQGRSLMPEGLEVGLKPQDLADLLEFIVGGR